VRDADDSDALLTEDRPVMYEVPVVWPSGGAGYWHPGLEEGDEVMVVCSDVDFSSWRATGATSDPSDKRPHRYASAVAFPCVRSRAKVLPDSDVMLAAGGETSSMMRAEAFSFFLGSLKNLLAADTSGPLTGPTIAGYIETALTALDTSTMAFASERIKTDELALPPPP
jgi:hypothetical protein